MLLVAGGSFAAGQFVSSNYLDYALTDVFSSLTALAVTLAFLRVWHPAPDAAFAVAKLPATAAARTVPAWQGWLPWVVVSAVVIVWTHFKVFALGARTIAWPELHDQVLVTLYHDKPYAALYVFQPLASGTAILLAGLLTAALVGVGPGGILRAAATTWRQARIAILTVALIIALAYLMNYAGMTYTLGLGVSKSALLFPLLSPFLGWLAVFLSGSDTSGNALFGNLQVVAANQLGLNPVLIAAANSSGGVMGKMISPQNIATGVSVTDLKGQEGVVFARTFKHSVVLTLVLGGLVLLQEYVLSGMIPR